MLSFPFCIGQRFKDSGKNVFTNGTCGLHASACPSSPLPRGGAKIRESSCRVVLLTCPTQRIRRMTFGTLQGGSTSQSLSVCCFNFPITKHEPYSTVAYLTCALRIFRAAKLFLQCHVAAFPFRGADISCTFAVQKVLCDPFALTIAFPEYWFISSRDHRLYRCLDICQYRAEEGARHWRAQKVRLQSNAPCRTRAVEAGILAARQL